MDATIALIGGLVIFFLGLFSMMCITTWIERRDDEQNRQHTLEMAKLGLVWDDDNERWVPIGTGKERTDIEDEEQLRTEVPQVPPEA